MCSKHRSCVRVGLVMRACTPMEGLLMDFIMEQQNYSFVSIVCWF